MARKRWLEEANALYDEGFFETNLFGTHIKYENLKKNCFSTIKPLVEINS